MGPTKNSQWNQILASRTTILLVLFGVTGFLGLPLLWISPAFTTLEKLLWSILNTIYTLGLIAMVIGIGYWCYLQWQGMGPL